MASSSAEKFQVPLYLFKGPEFGKKNDTIAELKAKARKNFAEVEFSTFYVSETPLNEIMMQFSNGSLFSEARFFVVKAAETIKKKDDVALIEDWAKAAKEQKDGTSIMVLVTDENSVDAKLEKIVPKDNVKMFWEMFENEKLPWVKNYFSKNGFKITDEAARSILDMVENNTEELKSECSRFFVCFPDSHVIDADDVYKILAHNKEETAYTLFDAMCDSSKSVQHRFEESLEILQKIISASKSDGYTSLLLGLLYSFRQLKKWCIINENGRLPEAQLKSNGFYIKSAWATYDKACRLWNPRQIQKIIALLTDCDMELRSSSKALADSMVQMALYQIIVKGGAPILQYEAEI